MRSLLLASAVWWIVLAATAHAGDGGIADPPQTAVGRRVYQTQCASCHGVRAEGAPNWQQPNQQGEMPAPPHNQEGHTWRQARTLDHLLSRLRLYTQGLRQLLSRHEEWIARLKLAGGHDWPLEQK